MAMVRAAFTTLAANQNVGSNADLRRSSTPDRGTGDFSEGRCWRHWRKDVRGIAFADHVDELATAGFGGAGGPPAGRAS
jgi:hypothetical protein